MYTITKEFSFDAAHCLPHLPSTHKCARPHGHTYRVVVELAAEELNEDSFVVDYGELDAFKQYIDAHIDHRDLNQVFHFPTTAEKLAKHFFLWCFTHWPQTLAVTVCETPRTSARYQP